MEINKLSEKIKGARTRKIGTLSDTIRVAQ